jgi:chromosome segregation ATPase
VPDEVSFLHNMDEENIQSQDQSYFLLNLSPGKVAKKLNKVAGLEQMDKALKEINSMVRKLVGERKALGKTIDDLRSRIAEMNWIPKARNLHRSIKKLEDEELDIEHRINKIEQLILDLAHYKKKAITTLPNQAVKQSDAMSKLAEEYQNLDNSIEVVSDILQQININQNKINKWQDCSDFNADSLRHEYEDLEYKIQMVSKIIGLIENDYVYLSDIHTDILKLEKEYQVKLKKCGICPTCGAKT